MTVTVMGSCRVIRPFRMLAAAGRVELRNAGVYGYVHNAKQVIQQLEVMHGRRAIPAELAPYILHLHIPEAVDGWVPTPRNDLSATDRLIVELSTLKEIEYDGHYLQSNRLRKRLVGDDPQLQRWWRELQRDDGAMDREAYARGVEDPVARAIVASARVTMQDEAALLEDMRTIRSFFAGPLVFVSHFSTVTPKGARMPARDALVRAVGAGARALDCGFYDPTLFLEAFGRDRAIADMAHYTPAFERALADEFAERFAPAPA